MSNPCSSFPRSAWERAYTLTLVPTLLRGNPRPWALLRLGWDAGASPDLRSHTAAWERGSGYSLPPWGTGSCQDLAMKKSKPPAGKEAVIEARAIDILRKDLKIA